MEQSSSRNNEVRPIVCGVLCKTCGRELGLIRVTNYGGERKCRKCKKRKWGTGYYKDWAHMTSEEKDKYEERNKNKGN